MPQSQADFCPPLSRAVRTHNPPAMASEPQKPSNRTELAHMPGHGIRRLQQTAVALFMQDAEASSLTPVQFAVLHTLVAQHAGIAVLPETLAQRLMQELPVRWLALEERWAALELRVCFRGWETLSSHGRQLVSYLTQN